MVLKGAFLLLPALLLCACSDDNKVLGERVAAAEAAATRAEKAQAAAERAVKSLTSNTANSAQTFEDFGPPSQPENNDDGPAHEGPKDNVVIIPPNPGHGGEEQSGDGPPQVIVNPVPRG